jgi:hypothetical protein
MIKIDAHKIEHQHKNRHLFETNNPIESKKKNKNHAIYFLNSQILKD